MSAAASSSASVPVWTLRPGPTAALTFAAAWSSVTPSAAAAEMDVKSGEPSSMNSWATGVSKAAIVAPLRLPVTPNEKMPTTVTALTPAGVTTVVWSPTPRSPSSAAFLSMAIWLATDGRGRPRPS